jgi:opacity protein-like surface antigen
MRTNIHRLGCALALLTTAAFPSPASADEGWYLGLGVGHVEYGDEGTVNFAGESFAAREQSDSHDPSSSISLWVGYRFNRHLALEAGYLDNAQGDFTLTNAADEAVATFVFATRGATFALVGSVPLGKWEPYARLGVWYTETDVRIWKDGAQVFGRRESGAELLTSLGLAYNFTPRWQTKLDIAFVPDAGQRTGTGASNVGVATLGFTYRF